MDDGCFDSVCRREEFRRSGESSLVAVHMHNTTSLPFDSASAVQKSVPVAGSAAFHGGSAALGLFGSNERTVDLRPGMQLVLGDFRFSTPRSFRFNGDAEVCDLAFVLSGIIRNRLSCTPEEIVLAPMQAALWLTPEMDGLHECAPDEDIRFACVRIRKSVLVDLVGPDLQHFPVRLRALLEGRGSGFYHDVLPMTASMLVSANRIFQNSYGGRAGRLMLESGALELISHVVAGLDGSKFRSRSHGRYDIQIRQVCHLLSENMDSPPSLVEISRIVGMSESLLTREFRKIHGVSIFEYLRIKRLDKARELLGSGVMNATDVAYALGFSSPGHFSRLFSRRFHVNPGEYRRQLFRFP